MRADISSKRTTQTSSECVSGVLIVGQRVLVEKRREDNEADPGHVMLPGGHVEKGESLEEALKREMKEELGIVIDEAEPVRVRDYTASNGERQNIHYFHIRQWTGKIVSQEAESVYWESEIGSLSDTTERAIVAKLLTRIARF